MLAYIGRRVLQMIPVFIGITVILFLIRSPAIVPGDPVRMIVGERAISQALYDQVVRENALDKPLYYQYGRYLTHLVQGDLGESYQLKRPVTHILFEKFPNTLKLALVALLIESVIGLAAGILSAVKKYSFWDVLVTLTTSMLVSVPVFWLGMGLQVLFGVKFKQWGLPYLPVYDMTSRDFPTIVHFILPGFTLASVSMAYAARITRSQLLEVMGQDYMRTAAAKGLSGREVIWKHGMKNAMIPVVTFLGMDLGAMVGGTILTETVFNWPGVGLQIYNAIQLRDWPIVTGGVIIIVFMVMIINLVVDISYAFLDPRIRYTKVAK
ncbi:MAG: ABC transporter permease [Thermoleophilia bacterium]|nr:ABC transporter permease [Thermoleophilia bacterium]